MKITYWWWIEGHSKPKAFFKKKKAPKEVTTKLFKVIEGKVHKSSQKKTYIYMLCSEQLT